MSFPKKDREFTYTDYLMWPENERVEIIAGKPALKAAPSRIHQEILSELHRQIANFLVDKNCKVYPAPFTVVLDIGESEKERKNIVEPDLTIVCDLEKLDERGCMGSPNMIVEIISPSTVRRDKIDKFSIYEEAGVQEYWIVEPEPKIVTVFTLQNKRYGRPHLYSEEDRLGISILSGCKINLSMVFS